MAPILYTFECSPPCRAVMMLAKAIEVPLDIKILDMEKFEHLHPDFIKVNPTKQIKYSK